MTIRPKLSVIIPTKNEEKLLGACLASLKAQRTSFPFELIVVDTKSSDTTVSIAQKYGARVIHESGKGKVYAYRQGADEARGDILCFTEADCVVPPDWIESIVSHFAHHKNVVAVSGTYTFYHSTPLYRFLAWLAHPIGHALHLLLFRHHHIRTSNFAVRKSTYVASGGFAITYPELYDAELSHRLSHFGEIDILPQLQIQTSDRRIRGRLFTYIGELYPAIIALLFHKPLTKQTYADIR